MPLLFEPLTIRGITMRNRAWMAPMCQYSVFNTDGIPTDWHLVHLGARATGGFGLVMTEATAVSAQGRISPHDTGLWSDTQIAPWRRITEFIRSAGATPAIQLAHAGRKASTPSPFNENSYPGSVPESAGGWPTIAPSASPFGSLAVPSEMSVDDISHVITLFVESAHRAVKAGFDIIEIHAAHGYLLHQFLSPLSNRRQDEYGGSFDGRTKILTEMVDAIRAAIPDELPLFVRFSATDWVEGGWTVEDTARLSKLLKAGGVDLVDVSSGGAVPDAAISVGPGYQVPFSRYIRDNSDIPTAAVGLITEPSQAEQILADGSADAILLGRVALREAGWPMRAASELGVPADDAPYAAQYRRAPWKAADSAIPSSRRK